MKRKISFTNIGLFLILVPFIGCNALKHVGEGDYLLAENRAVVNDKQKQARAFLRFVEKESDYDLTGLFIQRPNKTFLRVPARLHLYNLADSLPEKSFDNWLHKKPKREKRMDNFLSSKQVENLKRNYAGINRFVQRIGEPPSVLNLDNIKATIKNIKAYYNSIGYFQAGVNYKIDTLKRRRARVNYLIKTGSPYVINQVKTRIESPLIDSLYTKNATQSLIQKGAVYQLKNMADERDRLFSLFRDSGVYNFQKDAISFEVQADTVSKRNYNIDVFVVISKSRSYQDSSMAEKPYKIHTIKDVRVFIGNPNDTYNDSILYNDLNIYFKDKPMIKPKAFVNLIDIRKGSVYSDKSLQKTYNQLNSLKTLRYTGINYNLEKNTDDVFNADIFLFTQKRFHLTASSELSNSALQDFGIRLNPSLTIRNIFRGGEILSISPNASIGFQRQFGNTKIITEYGGDINLYFPKILFLPYSNRIPFDMKPETRISIGTGFQRNIGLDKQNIRALFSYKWSPSNFISHIIEPIGIEYIQNLNVDNFYSLYSTTYNLANTLSRRYPNLVRPGELNDNGDLAAPDGVDSFLSTLSDANVGSDSSVAGNILFRKRRLTVNNLILGGNYNYIYSNRQNPIDNNFFQFNGRFEGAGNLLSLVSPSLNMQRNAEGQYMIAGIPFSQYSKISIDFIKYIRLFYGNVLAMRFFYGIAIPYGNSNSIPFLKNFFAGGPNDNRGWLAYSLGPGASYAPNDYNEANMKIAFNLEYRFTVTGGLKGALFADLGNIWNIGNNKDIAENTLFEGFRSLENIAMSTGFGLRYDFKILVVRTDLGFKTYNPALPADARWFSEFNVGASVLNFAINYPF